METADCDGKIATYAVHLPDGRQVIQQTKRARGDWAIANVMRKRGGWRVTEIYDAKDAESMRKRGVTVTTAERIVP